jgi:hypothetical protein
VDFNLDDLTFDKFLETIAETDKPQKMLGATLHANN